MTPTPLFNWRGHTAVVVASGPSLTDEQITLIEHSVVFTIAVNNSYAKLQHPDVVYACDYLWWKLNHMKAKQNIPRRQLWTQDRAAAEQFQLSHIQWEGKDGLGKRGLRVNGNSGAGAINLAYHFGARRILLVGMDMKPGPNGEKHWHPDHPKPLVQGQQFEEWRKKMGVLAADLKTEGVEVINCTPGSALTCFPMGDLEQELVK
ncbi:MAG: DUF115 domain-containing protein [Proteobacteria bacterium]|nr:DUF115 domain-containing protein [Pseudomonadota bacterium]